MEDKQCNPGGVNAHTRSQLPEGYYEEWDGDFVWLRRPDGSVAGVFSDMGATDEGIAHCAWSDPPARELSANKPQERA